MRGEIKLVLEGASLVDTQRFKQIIDDLFIRGVFNIKNGKAILNFDEQGNLAVIEVSKYYRRSKPENSLREEATKAILEIVK